MQSSIIFRYVEAPKRTKMVYSEKTQLQEVLLWESSKFWFPLTAVGFRSFDCGSGIDQGKTGAWNDVVDLKKQHGEMKQNFTKQTQLVALCRRRYQREGMSTRGWQGKLKAGKRFQQTAQS